MDQALDNLKQMIAMFLSEAIRTKRITLARAAEISQRVVADLPFIMNESGALMMLTDIEKDFGEITVLKQALHFGYHASDIKIFEQEIKDYAAKIFVRDIPLSNRFLQDAASVGMTIQQLCLKYPDFCDYLQNHTNKAEVLREIAL